MSLWHVAFPGFLIISSVSGIVNVTCLVVPVAACLLFWVVRKPLLLPGGLSKVQITKCEITVSVRILEGADTRAFGTLDYYHLLKYQLF
jgi:hypothetical protein